MKKLLLLLSFISSFAHLYAQPGKKDDKNKGKNIEALYVAYITREIKLTEEEARQFWPVHNQYDNEIRATISQTNELERQQSILNIKKKYQDKFVKIIGNERTNEFYKTDAAFREKMIQRLRKTKQQKSNSIRF